MLQNNKYYYDISKENEEPQFDPYYIKNKVVLPATKEAQNKLTENNHKLIDLITAFKVDIDMGKLLNDGHIADIVKNIIKVLKTDNINYSAFCQFFFVHNSSYASYGKLKEEDKFNFILDILQLYCKERHAMYQSHGYTDIILQVVCDNYSHKRNSKTSINKFCELILSPSITKNLTDESKVISDNDYYFLPDKGGKKCFNALLDKLNIKMESRNIEQNKLPDIVFKHNEEYYIFELKTMKGSGGGQNKQAVEFAYFLKFSEKNEHVHYGVFLDSLYANTIFIDNTPKIKSQREDIEKALAENSGNYFVNTKGATELIQDLFS